MTTVLICYLNHVIADFKSRVTFLHSFSYRTFKTIYFGSQSECSYQSGTIHFFACDVHYKQPGVWNCGKTPQQYLKCRRASRIKISTGLHEELTRKLNVSRCSKRIIAAVTEEGYRPYLEHGLHHTEFYYPR
jgi:hypothetical protein